MAKRKISAKEAVSDIRSGMVDYDLMTKYQLASDGLQSLFDKLVAGGYIDLAEVEGRIPGFWGTVSIADPGEVSGKDGRQPAPRKSIPQINAQEAARDIRLGMTDSALMDKYRLSSKGLQSMVAKLVSLGLITQDDLDRRHMGIEHTVDLKEELLSLSQVLKYLGQPVPTNGEKDVEPKPGKANETVSDQSTTGAQAGKDEGRPSPQKQEGEAVSEIPWYENSILVILLLIVFFPLGFYSLYLNSLLSRQLKIVTVAAWTLLSLLCAIAGMQMFG